MIFTDYYILLSLFCFVFVFVFILKADILLRTSMINKYLLIIIVFFSLRWASAIFFVKFPRSLTETTGTIATCLRPPLSAMRSIFCIYLIQLTYQLAIQSSRRILLLYSVRSFLYLRFESNFRLLTNKQIKPSANKPITWPDKVNLTYADGMPGWQTLSCHSKTPLVYSRIKFSLTTSFTVT